MYNILICDDEKDIVSALRIYLTREDYRLFAASTGREALEIIAQHPIDLVLLDIMMPVMDGLTALTKMRQTCNCPVILLTAKSEDVDIIGGLNAGADDYVTKPFKPMELLARVRSQLRRYRLLGGTGVEDELRAGGIALNDRTKQVSLDGEPVSLTPTEYDILHLLLRHPGKVFSADEIYRAVWQEAPLGAERVVAVHIRHLREKLEIDPAKPRYLRVVWGKGYCCTEKQEVL
ncbi:MAG: response regulator transcription factor [Clostridiales bacterium]|nr:response regulator transcription factor [Clostridiales bacterium]